MVAQGTKVSVLFILQDQLWNGDNLSFLLLFFFTSYAFESEATIRNLCRYIIPRTCENIHSEHTYIHSIFLIVGSTLRRALLGLRFISNIVLNQLPDLLFNQQVNQIRLDEQKYRNGKHVCNINANDQTSMIGHAE